MQAIRKRVVGHRRRLCAAGSSPVQMWIPDTRHPGFAKECRRQTLSLRDDPAEQAALHFMGEISDWTDD
jgi:hypothetical protein